MSKKVVVFILLAILLPSAFAEWFYDSEYITTRIGISSKSEIIKSSPNGYVDSATVNVTFYPKKTENQKIISLYSEPQADNYNDVLVFHWKNPKDEIKFEISADVRTANRFVKVRDKLDFPIKDLDEDLEVYTQQSITIDSNNPGIVKLASEIVKGEDDLYSAVFKVAQWTKYNINYNLSTQTAEVSQKASWVLENKQGVCDELTSLFIALLRAVGIPARFVSGISYTNSTLFPQNWGPHGWAEVYFPNYGWIPFDATYGEFGWVDPTHVKFKDSVDSDEPSTYYQWLGKNTELLNGQLELDTEILETEGTMQPLVSTEGSVLYKIVNFGSYNLIEATVENPNDFYYATEAYLTKPKELQIIGNEANSILLMPKEKKKVAWIVKVANNLDSRYSYTFPILINTINGPKEEVAFEASVRAKSIALSDAQEFMNLIEKEREKKYSANVDLKCSTAKDEFYEYEEGTIGCHIKNTGNIFLGDMDLCYGGKCNTFELGISQSKNFSFRIKNLAQNIITLKSDELSKYYYANFTVIDEPRIEIGNVEYPISVSYGQNYTVSFLLKRNSNSEPKKISVEFKQNKKTREWKPEAPEGQQKFVLNLLSNTMKYGTNDYRVSVKYYDNLGKVYITEKEFSISLNDATFFQRILLFLNRIENSDYGTIAVLSVAILIAFLVIMMVLFKRVK